MYKVFAPSDELQEHVLQFFTSHNMALLNQNLRRQLFDYLEHELKSNVPLYFDDFLYPFNDLLDLIDMAARELQAFEVEKKLQQQNIPSKQSTKEKVIAFAEASLCPEKIFMLQHTIIDEQEIFDLLIIIPSTSTTSFNCYEQVLKMAEINRAVIHASLHKADVIYQQLKEGHIYYTLVCNTNNLVYDKGGNTLPVAGENILDALVVKAKQEFDMAYKKATGFLKGATDYYNSADLSMTCFMLEQATEIVIRGLITALLGNSVKTHCLRELKKPLQRCAPEIEYLLTTDAAEEMRLLQLLEKAYLESRYSNIFIVSNEDATVLCDSVRRLLENVTMVFEKKVEQLGSR